MSNKKIHLTFRERAITMTTENRVPTLLGFFFLGAAAGAVAALLLAPKSGAELRDEISEGVGNAVNQVRSSGKDLKHRTQKLVSSVRASVEEAVDAGKAAYDNAKNA
jgi:gas vesicle protein